jgi:hypothetical protein
MRPEKKDIVVLGVGTPKDRALMITVWAAARKLGLPANIVLVTDLDRILASGAQAIPALVFEGQVVSEGELPSATEVIALLQFFFANPLKVI